MEEVKAECSVTEPYQHREDTRLNTRMAKASFFIVLIRVLRVCSAVSRKRATSLRWPHSLIAAFTVCFIPVEYFESKLSACG